MEEKMKAHILTIFIMLMLTLVSIGAVMFPKAFVVVGFVIMVVLIYKFTLMMVRDW